MPFFQVVDELTGNPKIQALTRRAITGDLEGPAALSLWTVAGSMCQQSLTDGVVSPEMIISQYLNPDLGLRLAQVLVDVGLWHAHGHACPRCKQPPEGSWIFHDWFDLRYESGEKVKVTRGKRAELKDRKTTNAVWVRDRISDPLPGGDMVGRCRYCGTEIHRKMRSTWQYDHVDPMLYVGATNIVLCCSGCNLQKAQRTPQEAGMVLHRPRWAPGEPDWVWPPVESDGVDAGAPAGEVEQGVASHADASAGAPPAPHRGVASPAVAPAAPSRQPDPCRSGNAAPAAAATEQLSTRTRAGQGRAGQGQGKERVEAGSWQGSGTAGPGEPPAPRRKRRHRSRKPKHQPAPTSQPSHGQGPQPKPASPPGRGQAGSAPEPREGGRFGSPWYGYHGRPPEVDEAICPQHGAHVPCRFCVEEES